MKRKVIFHDDLHEARRLAIDNHDLERKPQPPSIDTCNLERQRAPKAKNSSCRNRFFKVYQPLSPEEQRKRSAARNHEMCKKDPQILAFYNDKYKRKDMSNSRNSSIRIKVEAKRALSRDEQRTSKPGNAHVGRSFGGGGNIRTKKIFVGGLPSTLTDEEFRQYFESYGDVTDVVIMFDQNTNRPRGFGFITFDKEDAVDRVLQKSFHELNNKLVEVKRDLPKDANSSGGGGGGSGGARGGGYQGYGSSGASTGAFDSRMDGNRFPQQQTTAGGGYPPYSGYGNSVYGFGAPSSNPAYGGYGGYGVGGYGTANAGFVGPAGAYGNPNAANSGYAAGAPSMLKNTWSNQTPGYGASAGYGAGVPWNAPGTGGAATAPVGQTPNGASGYGNHGQTPNGASGYGNQGYGYGNYGGNAPNAGSGNSGGEQQGSGAGGYYGSNGSSGY